VIQEIYVLMHHKKIELTGFCCGFGVKSSFQQVNILAPQLGDATPLHCHNRQVQIYGIRSVRLGDK